MIKEKHKWYISIVSMFLSVVLIVSLVFLRGGNSSTSSITEKTLASVLDKESITEINIDIDESDWNWLIENATDEEYRSGNITINGETFYNVGIRPKGNTSLTNVAKDDTTDRYSFKIKFDEYVDGQTYHGIESIVLNNNIQDNTSMKEYITYDLYEFLGVATPEMSYSYITVNNDDWGLYLAIEVVDERYLENNFGTTEGNLYKPETMGVGGGNNNGKAQMGGGEPPNKNGGMQNTEGAGGNHEGKAMPPQNEQEKQNGAEGNNETAIENNAESGQTEKNETKGLGQMGGNGNPGGSRPVEGADFVYIDDDVSSYSIVRDSAVFKRTTDDDFEKVINMYKNLNDGTNLEDVLDVEEVLKYFAVNTYVVNLDSYSGQMYHNYYLYENNGKCQILPWDLNLSFGGYGTKNGGSGTSSTINFPIDNPVSGDLENMPLIGKLLEVDEYKELYHSYLQQIADEYFNSGYYANLVNKIDTLISPYVEKDPTAFCTYEEYKASIPEMITFGEDRTKSVLAQLSGEQPSTTYGNIESTINMSALGDMGGGGGKPDEKGNNANEADSKTTTESQNGVENGDMVPSTQNNETVPKDINISEQNQDSHNKAGQEGMQQKQEANDKNNENADKNVATNMEHVEHSNGQNNGTHDMKVSMNNNQTMVYLGILAGCLVLGIAAILFTFKFKRKGKLK